MTKKWWLWLLIAAAVLVVLGAAGYGVYRLGYARGTFSAAGGEALRVPQMQRIDLLPGKAYPFSWRGDRLADRFGIPWRLPWMHMIVSPLALLFKGLLGLLVVVVLVLLIIRLSRREGWQQPTRQEGAAIAHGEDQP